MAYRVRVQPTGTAVEDRRSIHVDTDDETTARRIALEQCGGGSVVWAVEIEDGSETDDQAEHNDKIEDRLVEIGNSFTEEGASNPDSGGAENA